MNNIQLLYGKGKFIARITDANGVYDLHAKVSRQKGTKFVKVANNIKLTSYFNNGKRIKVKFRDKGKDKELFIN